MESGCLHLRRVPLPVDLGRFQPAADRAALRERLAKEHGLPASGPLLLVVAAFVRRKNQHHAVQLFAEIRKHQPKALRAFVGATPEREDNRRYRLAVERLVTESGLAGAVHFMGALERPALSPCRSGGHSRECSTPDRRFPALPSRLFHDGRGQH